MMFPQGKFPRRAGADDLGSVVIPAQQEKIGRNPSAGHRALLVPFLALSRLARIWGEVVQSKKKHRLTAVFHSATDALLTGTLQSTPVTGAP